MRLCSQLSASTMEHYQSNEHNALYIHNESSVIILWMSVSSPSWTSAPIAECMIIAIVHINAYLDNYALKF